MSVTARTAQADSTADNPQGFLEELLAGRPLAKGVSIDKKDTRRIDDAFLILPQDDGGWLIDVSLADAPALVLPGTRIDTDARHLGRDVHDGDKLQRMLPEDLVQNFLSLGQGGRRPAITFTIDLDAKGAVRGYDVQRTMFQSDAQLSRDDVRHFMQRPDNKIHEWMKVAVVLHRARQDRMIALASNGVTTKIKAPQQMPDSMHRDPGEFLVEEIMLMTNALATDYLDKHDLPSVKDHYGVSVVQTARRVRDEFNRKASGICGGVAQSIADQFSAHANVTSPMRVYNDLFNLRVIAAHLERQPIPCDVMQAEQVQKRQRDLAHYYKNFLAQTEGGLREVLPLLMAGDLEGAINKSLGVANAMEREMLNTWRRMMGQDVKPDVLVQKHEQLRDRPPQSAAFDALAGQMARNRWPAAQFSVFSVKQASAKIHCATIHAGSPDRTANYCVTAGGFTGADAFDRAARTVLTKMAQQLPRQFSAYKGP